MEKIYRFYAYNNFWWPDKYLWIQGETKAYLMMSAANFIDTLLDMLGPDPFAVGENRSLIKTDTIHIDMDKMRLTHPDLALKTVRMIQDFDDVALAPDIIDEWLEEVERWLKFESES